MSWPIKKQAGNCYSDLTRLCEREKFKLRLLFWILKRKEDKVNDNISFEICRLWQHVQRRQRGHGLHGHHRHHGYQHSRATAALGLLRHLCRVYDFVVNITVGPWEARFLGNEKTRAALNRGHHRHHSYQSSRGTAALGLLHHLCTVYHFVFNYYMLGLTNDYVPKKFL